MFRVVTNETVGYQGHVWLEQSGKRNHGYNPLASQSSQPFVVESEYGDYEANSLVNERT